MHSVRALGPVLIGLAVLASCMAACGGRSPTPRAVPPVVAGLAVAALDARGRGLVLLGELGCVACHQQGGEGDSIDPRRGPDLAQVRSRVHADYLPRFLADPRGVEPGTTMPDLLRDRGDAGRADAAAALAQYLMSLSGGVPGDELPDEDAAVRGRQLFHEVGCVACHAPRDADGREIPLPNSVPLGELAAKYRPHGLRAFLLAPHDARPSLRMPSLQLTPTEAHELSSYLLTDARRGVAGTAADPQVDAALSDTGRALFDELGCGACHSLGDAERNAARSAPPLAQLADARGGCVGTEPGPWPGYDLSKQQGADIAAALRGLDAPRTDEQRILQRLAARNCTACHRRGASGGVAPERLEYFTTSDQSLGEASRIPPQLTLVGAKLQRDWLVDAIAHGQAVRPYLRTRMPGFGATFAAELGELLGRTDRLPPLELPQPPEDRKQRDATRELGRELVGDQGMNCITCHTFAGESVGTMAAVDLVDSTAQRLRREWFAHYLRDPVQFRPGTLMPQFFVDGASTRPELGGGDVTRQIDAIWSYLAEGRNTRRPRGMRHPPIELLVGDETVMLRRSVQRTGKRGISVGYPLGVNLTFDAESLGMNQVWWGRFVDAAGVFTGQGSGEARILGEDLATLPKGPGFVALPGADAPWPEASRRELGQRFLGYDLDAQQRPAFRYLCSDVTITDAPVAIAAAAGTRRPILRRTITFESDAETLLHFRAARDARVDDLGDGVVQVGSALRLRLTPASYRIRPAGAELELIVEIPIPERRTTLVVDYSWREGAK